MKAQLTRRTQVLEPDRATDCVRLGHVRCGRHEFVEYPQMALQQPLDDLAVLVVLSDFVRFS
jgi:hypothetical protein